MEFTAKLQISCWTATQTDALESLTSDLFLWPDSVSTDTRMSLQQVTAEALLKKSVIVIPVDFTKQNTFLISPVLGGNEQRLRQLVMDLRTTPRDGRYNRELNKSIKSMPSLVALFPRLAVYVFLLHLRSTEAPSLRRAPFDDEVLRFSNLMQVEGSTTWAFVAFKDTLLEFITTFGRSGPGKRKLVRFSSNQCWEGEGWSEVDIGPLVNISSQALSTGGRVVEEDTIRDAATASDAEVWTRTTLRPPILSAYSTCPIMASELCAVSLMHRL